jgi:hypothetical protein
MLVLTLLGAIIGTWISPDDTSLVSFMASRLALTRDDDDDALRLAIANETLGVEDAPRD